MSTAISTRPQRRGRSRDPADEDRARWPGWCCSYCAAPLQEDAHGLICAQDGLLAARTLIDDPSQLPRAEADMEALPLEPASMDLVLAAGVLHHAARPARTLLEMRRVTRRGGLVAVLDSPVYRRAVDGETM